MAERYTDEGTAQVFAELAPLRDGVRTRVLAMSCQLCGGGVDASDGFDAPFTVAAAVLRELAQLPHNDECDGRFVFETEPTDPPPQEVEA